MRRLGPVLGLAVILIGSGQPLAQTSSARSDSLEMTGRADRLLSHGEAARAARLYRRALELDSNNERAYIGMSACLDRQGEHLVALAMLDDAEALFGWTADIGLERGVHLYRTGRLDAAARELARVLSREPTSHRAAYFSASAQLALGHYADAVAGYSLYLRARPKALARRDDRVRTRRALALLALGKLTAANRDIDAVLTAAPDDRAARMLRFTALARAGDCRAALALFGELESLEPAAPTMRYNAAVCRFRLGDGAAALAMLDAHRDRVPEPPRAHLLRARIYAEMKDAKRAASSYRAAIAAGLPVTAEFANWLNERGDHRTCIAMLWPRVERGTRDPEVLAAAVAALRATASWDRANIAARRLAEVRPDATSWRLVGDVELARRQLQEAESAYARAHGLDPKDRVAAAGLAGVLVERAGVALRSGDATAARALLERAHAADPSHRAATHNLALLELADHPRRSLELLADTDDPRGQLILGRACAAVGDRTRARNAFDAVVRSTNAAAKLRADAHAHLAHLLAVSDPEVALDHVARARAITEARHDDLDRVEAVARLASVERAYRSGGGGELVEALASVDAAKLPPSLRARWRLFDLFAKSGATGVAQTLRGLAAVPAEALAGQGKPGFDAATTQRAFALLVTEPGLRRPRDVARLRARVATLASSGQAGAELVGAWLDHAIVAALARPDGRQLARSLAALVPRANAIHSLRHNAVIALAAGAKLSVAQRRTLEGLTTTVAEAAINLAVAAEARGDHAAVRAYLELIPEARKSPRIREWMRWKELLYGGP